MVEWSDGYWWSSDGLRLHYRDYAGAGEQAADPLHSGPHPQRARLRRGCRAARRRMAADLRRAARARRERLCQGPDDLCPAHLFAGPGGADRRAGARALRPVRHLARRADDDAARGERARSGSPARCSTISAPRWRRAGSIISAPMSAARGTGRPGCTPPASSPRRRRDRYPDWELDQWLVYAKRLCKLTPGGRIVFDYDMRIAEPFKLPSGEAGFDLWPAFRALAGIPVAGRPRRAFRPAQPPRRWRGCRPKMPEMESVTVPRVGHAPTLDEPEAPAAIDRLLERIA